MPGTSATVEAGAATDINAAITVGKRPVSSRTVSSVTDAEAETTPMVKKPAAASPLEIGSGSRSMMASGSGEQASASPGQQVHAAVPSGEELVPSGLHVGKIGADPSRVVREERVEVQDGVEQAGPVRGLEGTEDVEVLGVERGSLHHSSEPADDRELDLVLREHAHHGPEIEHQRGGSMRRTVARAFSDSSTAMTR